MRAALALYRSSPDFAIQLSHQDDDTPGLRRIAEISLGILAEAGLDPRERAVSYQLLTNYAVGSGLFISQLTLDDLARHAAGGAPGLRRAGAGRVPALRRVGAPSVPGHGRGLRPGRRHVHRRHRAARARRTEERA